ncbi:hypothetical protein GE21DRAFT_1039369 [Neurospora crassa]|nr:hypothetical protein GE21DRAFT_1039369 [Neurospora crassa]
MRRERRGSKRRPKKNIRRKGGGGFSPPAPRLGLCARMKLSFCCPSLVTQIRSDSQRLVCFEGSQTRWFFEVALIVDVYIYMVVVQIKAKRIERETERGESALCRRSRINKGSSRFSLVMLSR